MDNIISIAITHGFQILTGSLVKCLNEVPDFQVVGHAFDGRNALDLARRTNPQVMLFDAYDDGKDSLDLVRDMRNYCEDTFLIALLTEQRIPHVRQLMKAGVKGMLIPSSNLEDLNDAIRVVINGDPWLPESLSRKLLGEMDATNKRHRLTEREHQVMTMLASGRSKQDIANKLNIAIKTVDSHRGRILEKLELSSNIELAHYAIRHGYISLKGGRHDESE